MRTDLHPSGQVESLDEMAILNVFIKTIFEPQAPFTHLEQRVHEALRISKQDLSSASVTDLGDHLKELSTDGIKSTVQGVKQRLQSP